MKRIILRTDSYFDSVFLMLINSDVKKIDGVSEAVVAMGTEMNLDLIDEMGMAGPELQDAGANDLIIAIEADSEAVADQAEATVERKLREKSADGGEQAWRPTGTSAALDAASEANLVVISLPGEYAAREARIALLRDRHVMMFSDNVSLDDEVALKRLAGERGLLMMGPDCGTAIINGTPLCFANVVPRGPIGVISASGTGLQEVTTLIARAGSGISQAIGTGGRDLKSEEVGAATTLAAMEALADDDDTGVIVVISKPPAPTVAEQVIKALEQTGKPSVVHLIGSHHAGPEAIEAASAPALKHVRFAGSLEEAARLSASIASGSEHQALEFDASAEEIDLIVEREASQFGADQRYLRGYFTGGTLSDEAVFILNEQLGGIHSFDPADRDFALTDPHVSRRHTIVDLGEDVFTVGRPHPMIDPSIRTERMDREAADPEIAVVVLDCVIGYGSHEDPAGALAPVVVRMKRAASERGGYLAVIASVTGTERDVQRLSAQRHTLQEAGVVVMPSNAQAARLAGRVMAKMEDR